MQELGKMEDQIFKDRQDKELSFKARNKAKRRRERLEQNRQPKWVPEGQFAPQVNRPLNKQLNVIPSSFNIGQQLDSGFIKHLIFCIVYLHVKPLGGGRHEVASVSNAKQEAMEMRKQGMSTEATSDDKSGARGK